MISPAYHKSDYLHWSLETMNSHIDKIYAGLNWIYKLLYKIYFLQQSETFLLFVLELNI